MWQGLTRAMILMLTGWLIYSPAAIAQQDSSKKQTKQQKKEQPERESRKRAERRELDGSVYRNWLEEVGDIILPEELDAFKKLSTNEERESYIEGFWGWRDPTPDTVENETRDEHYRRIAYANERFASGIPGRKTDRGRMYIIWGPPDEIESHPAGGPYRRPEHEGGGDTSVHPFETWRYRHLPGVGSDIVIEFVDPSGSGEYRMTMDPSEKDALANVPGAGLSEMELRGFSSKVDRVTRPDGTRLPLSAFPMPANMSQFARLEQFARVQMPPGHFKPLEQMVLSRILRDEIKFAYRFDFIRITEESVLVPVTLQIPNREMHFELAGGVHAATLNVFVRVSTLTGRVVQTFEDAIRRDLPDSTFRTELEGQSVYQRALPLRSGLYRLDVVIKDVASGDVGTIAERLAVPRFAADQLASSTLILADKIEPVAPGSIGLGPFVLGATKVRPRLGAAFTTADHLGVYLQVYNLALDPITGKPSAAVRYRIGRDGKNAARAQDMRPPGNGTNQQPLGRPRHFAGTENNREPASRDQFVLELTETTEQLGQRGSQLTLEKLLPLGTLPPGGYTIEVEIKDRLTGQSITERGAFTVKQP